MARYIMSVAQQNRVARAARNAGGYDKLIELERERRAKLRKEKHDAVNAKSAKK